MYKYYVYPDELYHHGVKGMKWGVRHDKERVKRLRIYASMNARAAKTGSGPISKINQYNANYYNKKADKIEKRMNMSEAEKKAKRLKALKIGGAVVGTALASYGGYKLGKHVKDSVMEKNFEIARFNGRKEVQSMIDGFAKMDADALKAGSTHFSYDINPDKIVGRYVDEARGDDFKQALKNVRRFNKSGQNLNFMYTGATNSSR